MALWGNLSCQSPCCLQALLCWAHVGHLGSGTPHGLKPHTVDQEKSMFTESELELGDPRRSPTFPPSNVPFQLSLHLETDHDPTEGGKAATCC